MIVSINVIERTLRRSLSLNRYQHCVAVGQLAAALAKRHGWDEQMAYRAGLLHDCVKEWSPAKLKAYVKKFHVRVPDFRFIEKNGPNLLHAYVGAHWARRQGWLRNREALTAIASHTLGRRGMNRADMILFVADFASKDRVYRSARKARLLAFKDLRAAYRLAASKKIKWNLSSNKPVHPHTIKVWNSLVS